MDALIYSQQQWKDDNTPRMTIIPRKTILLPDEEIWEEGRITGNSLVKNIMKSDSIKIYIQGFLFMLKTFPYLASFDSITLKIDSSLSVFNNSLLAWICT